MHDRSVPDLAQRKENCAHPPGLNFGRVQFVHSKIAAEKLYPGSEIVSEGWPKLFAGDYAAHITKAIAANPDLLVTSLWGGDYVAFYKQGLRFGMFDRMKVIANIGFRHRARSIGQGSSRGDPGGRPCQLSLLSAGERVAAQQAICRALSADAGTSIPTMRRRAPTRRSICSSTLSRRPMIFWARGRNPVRSSPCWKAW